MLYGYDVLPSAVHLTASTLALLAPETCFHKMHLYSLPMGRMQSGQIYLGSIDYISADTIFKLSFTILMSPWNWRGSASGRWGCGVRGSPSVFGPLRDKSAFRSQRGWKSPIWLNSRPARSNANRIGAAVARHKFGGVLYCGTGERLCRHWRSSCEAGGPDRLSSSRRCNDRNCLVAKRAT